MNSLNKTARITGVLYLIITALAPFSMMYVPSKLIVVGDAARTAGNLLASQGLFRLAIAGDAVVFLIEIAIVALLYVLLRPVNKTLALVAAFSRLAMTVVQGVNLLTYLLPLMLLGGVGYLSVFEPGQLHALVLLFLNLHGSVALVWGLFFGLHLLVLGYLVYKSGYISRVPGVALLLASLCYLVQGFGNILLPGHSGTFAAVGFLSIVEVVFPLWLLIKGVKGRAAVAAGAD